MPLLNKPKFTALVDFPEQHREKSTLRRGGGFLASMQDLRAGFKAGNFLYSLSFAWEGLVYVTKTQRNFRIHLGMAATALGLSAMLQVSLVEWAIIWGVIGLVLFAELMNTVVELFVDMVTEGRYDVRAKVIKDMAAGAVFVTALSAMACGISIFLPHFLDRLLPFLGH